MIQWDFWSRSRIKNPSPTPSVLRNPTQKLPILCDTDFATLEQSSVSQKSRKKCQTRSIETDFCVNAFVFLCLKAELYLRLWFARDCKLATIICGTKGNWVKKQKLFGKTCSLNCLSRFSRSSTSEELNISTKTDRSLGWGKGAIVKLRVSRKHIFTRC